MANSCTCFYEGDVVDTSRVCQMAMRAAVKHLRHGIQPDTDGFLRWEQLAEAVKFPRFFDESVFWAHAQLDEKNRVERDTEGRFAACCGHSVPVVMGLPFVKMEEQRVAYHACPDDALEGILAEGIKPMSRQKVHMLATDMAHCQGNMAVGKLKNQRHYIIVVDIGDINARWASNGTILTDAVRTENIVCAFPCHAGGMEDDRPVIINREYFQERTFGGGLSDFPRTTCYEVREFFCDNGHTNFVYASADRVDLWNLEEQVSELDPYDSPYECDDCYEPMW